MTGLRRAAGNVFSLGAMRVLSAGFAVALVAYIARVHGAEWLGRFSLLFSVFLLTQQLPLLGLHVPIIGEAAASPASLAERTTNALVIAVCSSLLLGAAIAIGGVALYPHEPELHASFALIGASLLPTAWIAVSESVLVGQERMSLFARISVAESLLRTIAALACIAAGGGLTAVFTALLVARLAAAAAHAHRGAIGSLVSVSRVSTRQLTELIRLVPTYFGILVLGLLVTRIDMVALSLLGSMAQTGVYAAASKIYEIGLMVPSIVVTALYPAFVKSHAHARAQFAPFLSLTLRGGLVLGLPCAIAGAFLAAPLAGLLFGAEYEDAGAGAALAILLASLVFVWMHQVMTSALLAAKLQRLDLIAGVVAAAVYLPLLAFGILHYGAAGAAAATAAMWATQAAVRAFFVRRSALGAIFEPALLRVLGAGAAAGLLAYVLAPATGAAGLVVALIVYAGGIWLARGLTRSDIDLFGSRMQTPAAS